MGMFFSNIWPRQTLPSLVLGSITSAVGITVLTTAIEQSNVAVVYGMMALTGHGVGMRLNPGSLHGLAYFPSDTAAITCLASFAVPFGGTVALTLMATVFNNRDAGGVAEGIRWGFISILPFVWLSVLASVFLGNVWIRRDGVHEVVNGAYLWGLLTCRHLDHEVKVRHDDMLGPAGQKVEVGDVEKAPAE